MNWRTHEAITDAVGRLLGLDGELLSELKECAKSPDVSPDYTVTVRVTYSGKIRPKVVRLKHHEFPRWRLRRMVESSRRLWLEGKARKAVRRLGRTLHYIQDGFIPSPSKDKKAHDSVEAACSRVSLLSLLDEISLKRPVGRRETLKFLDKVQAKHSGREAVKSALEVSYAVASSVLSDPNPPEELRRHAESVLTRVRDGRSVIVPLFAIVLMYVPFLWLLSPPTALPLTVPLVILPSLWLSASLMPGLGKPLWAVCRIGVWTILTVAASLISSLVAWQVEPILTPASLAVAPIVVAQYLSFLRGGRLGVLRSELSWFLWR